MHYYPVILPNINKNKLTRFKKYSAETTMLYSDEGLFQVKTGKLYQVHFIDDNNSYKKKIGPVQFICDNSQIKWSPSNKLPYNFVRKDIMVNCYEKNSIKLYIEETNGKPTHIYFYIKDTSLHEIENEIEEILKLCV